MRFWKRKPIVLLAAFLCLLLLIAFLLSDSSKRGRLKLPVGAGAPAIVLAERHGLILASDGSLWSWGSDFLGWPVLGLSNGPSRSISLRRIGMDTNWANLSAGANHNVAIKTDGTIWTWGESVQPRYTLPMPVNAPLRAAPGNDWKQAAAGGIHSLAVKRDGTLWGWGNNWAGSVGVESTNGSAAPVQVGTGTNWVRVWAGNLESVALQSDGTLWYWGESPDAKLAKAGVQVFAPTQVSPDTNWVDVGFGVQSVLAIKSDGTLWAWGQQAEVFTGAADPAQNLVPMRVGSDSDWKAISACAPWWCRGLIKKDGSLWVLDASDGEPNGPRSPYKPVRFRRVAYQQGYVAYAAGATHAAGPGIHGPIGVALTADGQVWTWGMILGDPPTFKGRFVGLGVNVLRLLRFRASPPDPPPIYRDQPWQLRNE